MPYELRWLLKLPRGRHAPQRLLAELRPQPQERVLEIGGGVGIHAIPVAKALTRGALCTLDVQRPMLEALKDAAAEAGVTNIAPALGDAQALPFEDASFDAAYLITVLGEIPAPDVALAELRRVLKPGGRLLVGEMALDPDYVPLRTLKRLAAGAGLTFASVSESPLAYLAVFGAPEAPGAGSA
ncbi:MAG: methyltransferase domain-containing protein [Caulobacter sp.]|nr:methyltransferase domain-containing protein [Caulobacter sp.]